MPTYAENAHRREVLARRKAQDARDRVRHAEFDLQAQDKTANFERPSFIVTGEGSHSAQEAYRQNYDAIFGAARAGQEAARRLAATLFGDR